MDYRSVRQALRGKHKPARGQGNQQIWWPFAVFVVGSVVLLTLWQASLGPSLAPFGNQSLSQTGQTGELVVGRVVGATGATRGSPQGWYQQMVRLPSGRELPATLRELLPVGEHIWAAYSLDGPSAIRLDTYVRCGMSTCPKGTKPWDRVLEEAVWEAAMEPMLGDNPHTLSAEDQTTLAMWAIKGAMVHEALRSGRPAVFTSAERAQLREAKLPPRTKVWIAKCVDSPGPGCIAEDLFSADPSVATQVSGYVTTMAFGPLAFQVLNFRLPYPTKDSIDITAELRPGPWPSTAAQIWPIASPTLAWPMSTGLRGEAGIEAFSDRWKPAEANCE